MLHRYVLYELQIHPLPEIADDIRLLSVLLYAFPMFFPVSFFTIYERPRKNPIMPATNGPFARIPLFIPESRIGTFSMSFLIITYLGYVIGGATHFLKDEYPEIELIFIIKSFFNSFNKL